MLLPSKCFLAWFCRACRDLPDADLQVYRTGLLIEMEHEFKPARITGILKQMKTRKVTPRSLIPTVTVTLGVAFYWAASATLRFCGFSVCPLPSLGVFGRFNRFRRSGML